MRQLILRLKYNIRISFSSDSLILHNWARPITRYYDNIFSWGSKKSKLLKMS